MCAGMRERLCVCICLCVCVRMYDMGLFTCLCVCMRVCFRTCILVYTVYTWMQAWPLTSQWLASLKVAAVACLPGAP